MQRKMMMTSLGIAIYYSIFGVIYWLLLHFTYGNYINLEEGSHTVIGFSIRYFLSLIIYWIIFVRLRHWRLLLRIAIHLITLPLFLWLGFILFHTICDRFNILYLGGRYANWDIYIPMILYIGLFALIHSYEYFILFRNQRIKETALQVQILQGKLNSLKSHIQPHFLYNALNSINATIKDDQKETKLALSQLADTFRSILFSSEKEWVSIEEELQFIQKYLAIEQRRFKEKLFTHIQVDERVYQYSIPTMILQPLIENIMIHSVSSSVKPVNVYIHIDLEKDNILYNICDDGVGSDVEPKELLLHKGTGLKNVNQRLLLYFKAGLAISSNQPSGFCVSFRTPPIRYELNY